MSVMINYQKRRPKGPSITCFADVERIALRNGITLNTLQMLKDRGFGSIKTLREVTESDLGLLPLYVGQQLALSKLANHVNEVLAGYIIDDAPDEAEEGQEEGVPETQEEQKEARKKEQEERERQEAIERINQKGILSKEEYEEGTCGPRSLPRPHDFLVGKTSGKALFMEEFLYGSLLTLEFFMETNTSEVRPFMKHLRFIILKMVHGYPLDHIIYYDYALINKMEKENLLMPQEPDEVLLEKYLRLMRKEAEEEKTKKKKKKKKEVTKKKKSVT